VKKGLKRGGKGWEFCKSGKKSEFKKSWGRRKQWGGHYRETKPSRKCGDHQKCWAKLHPGKRLKGNSPRGNSGVFGKKKTEGGGVVKGKVTCELKGRVPEKKWQNRQGVKKKTWLCSVKGEK